MKCQCLYTITDFSYPNKTLFNRSIVKIWLITLCNQKFDPIYWKSENTHQPWYPRYPISSFLCFILFQNIIILSILEKHSMPTFNLKCPNSVYSSNKMGVTLKWGRGRRMFYSSIASRANFMGNQLCHCTWSPCSEELGEWINALLSSLQNS